MFQQYRTTIEVTCNVSCTSAKMINKKGNSLLRQLLPNPLTFRVIQLRNSSSVLFLRQNSYRSVCSILKVFNSSNVSKRNEVSRAKIAISGLWYLHRDYEISSGKPAIT